MQELQRAVQEFRAGGAVTTGAGAGAAGTGCCPALSLGSAPAAGVVSVGGELEGGSAAGVSGVVGSAVTGVWSRGSVVTGASSTGVPPTGGGAVGSSTVVWAAVVSGGAGVGTVVAPTALPRLVVLGHVHAVRAGPHHGPTTAPRLRVEGRGGSLAGEASEDLLAEVMEPPMPEAVCQAADRLGRSARAARLATRAVVTVATVTTRRLVTGRWPTFPVRVSSTLGLASSSQQLCQSTTRKSCRSRSSPSVAKSRLGVVSSGRLVPKLKGWVTTRQNVA